MSAGLFDRDVTEVLRRYGIRTRTSQLLGEQLVTVIQLDDVRHLLVPLTTPRAMLTSTSAAILAEVSGIEWRPRSNGFALERLENRGAGAIRIAVQQPFAISVVPNNAVAIPSFTVWNGPATTQVTAGSSLGGGGFTDSFTLTAGSTLTDLDDFMLFIQPGDAFSVNGLVVNQAITVAAWWREVPRSR